MISEVVMPQMGADMVEGTIVRWRKQEGDPVERGEIIAEIETDKANVEIEAFESGVFRRTLAHEGDVVPVGGVIAVIAAADDDISRYGAGVAQPAAAPEGAGATAPSRGAASAAAAPTGASAPPANAAPVAAPGTSNGRLRISPVARRLADERGIDVRTLRGSGPDGRIVKRDIERAAAATSAPGAAAAAVAPPPPRPATQASAESTPLALSKMRQAIARRMAASKREAPHYYLLVDVDMTAALAFRAQANAALQDDARISINDLLVRACALALRTYPRFNVTADGDTFTEQPRQHVCIAIALDDGLIAPALLDAGEKPLAQIARESKDLVARAKGGTLRPDELTAGTFSITNLGAYGIETLIGIIQPPQTAILGAGSVTTQPVVRDGQVVVRDVLKLALSADHRVTDGALGARFLGEIKRLLESPLLLVL